MREKINISKHISIVDIKGFSIENMLKSLVNISLGDDVVFPANKLLLTKSYDVI